jgi:tripartite-type tricarboxylate transporter receptor subunit TctC
MGEDAMRRLIARGSRLAMLVLVAASLVAPSARAQDYPNRPVRVIVPFVPGGTSDIIGRFLSPGMTEDLGQQIVIDNRAGAGGTIGADLVAKAAPDGYTVLLFHVGITYGPALYKALPYDVVGDFAPISLIGGTPSLLIVKASMPVHTVDEFLAHARAKPGAINYGSAGIGSSSHLGVALFESLTKIKLTQVPYKGSGAAVAAMIAGEVDCMVETIGSLVAGIKGGQLRAIAVSSEQRAAALPELPTMREAGVPDFLYTTWFALWAPAKTPRDIVDRLNRAVRVALARADTRALFATAGIDPETSTPEQLDMKVRSELARWAKIIPEAGIEPQ